MKTDPTSSITGAAGMPLAYEAVQPGRHAVTNANLKAKPKEAISDTVETTDREGDGRQPINITPGSDLAETEMDELDHLDLTG